MANDAVTEVRDRIDVVDLVQGYVPSLRKTGSSFKGLCPFHNEKTPSFIVFPDSQNFHCFGCGKGGDIFTFYMLVENVEFREALKELANRAGVELEVGAPQLPEEDEKRRKLIEVNELVGMWFHHVLKATRHGEPGRQVVTDRGISDEMVEQFRLGFAPDSWDALLNFLASRNISAELAAEAGLASKRDSGGYYDRFRNRLIFPIRDRDANIVGFGGRALGDAQPKYLNSPQTLIFDKSSLVYALDVAKDAIRAANEVVIVEGYMDAITAHQFGFNNVVASMGTALTEQQVAQIKRGSSRIVLALDSDAAGQMATLRGLETMADALDAEVRPVPTPNGLLRFERKLKAEISIVQLAEGKDPDEIIRKSPEKWPELIRTARPFLDFTIDMLTRDVDTSNPEAKSDAVRRIIPLLRQIPDGVKENHYTRMLARRLDISEQVIVSEKRKLSIGGKSAAIRAGLKPTAIEKVRRRSTEDYLVALLLRHHQLTHDILVRIPEEDIQDARNREIIALLRDPSTNELEGRDLTVAMDDELADHAEHLLDTLEGRPEQFPSHIQTEARQVLETLGRERFSFLMRQLHHSLQSAQQDQDGVAIQELREQIVKLSKRHAEHYPSPSPYFQDSRSERKF
ncbi:MAG TPA: DNA primase [Thermomicrobiales bacterium]|nr:DNA primase [Thermomicrobiales bacterium]